MGTMTKVTAKESGSQNNTASIRNTGGRYFSHFDTIEANPFREFEAFENNNNPLPKNNNNNNPSSLPPLGFGGRLEEDFNPPFRGNTKGLDSNVVALVNALIGANFRINHVERKSNHIKLINRSKGL